MYNYYRILIIMGVFWGSLFSAQHVCAQTQTSIVPDTKSSVFWAEKIIGLLPTDGRVAAIQDITLAELQNSGLDDIRYAVQDVMSDRIILDLDAVLQLYQLRAEEDGSERDVSLAKLYKVSRRPGDVTDFSLFDPFLESTDWFVVVAAYTEMTRQYNFSDTNLAAETLKKAVLNLSDGVNVTEYLEAQYNILIVAQTLSVVSGDLDAAYETSRLLLDSSVIQNRIIDRFVIVFNLAQLHQASYINKNSLSITEALLSYSQHLIPERQMLAMVLHGNALLAEGDAKDAINMLKSANEIANETGEIYFKLGLLFDLTNAYTNDGQIDKAEEVINELLQLQGGEGDEEFLDSVRAKIARLKGDYELSDSLQKKLTKKYSSLYNQSQINKKLDFDFRILEFVPKPNKTRVRSAPTIDLIGYSTGAEIGTLEDGILPKSLFRALKEFEIELQFIEPKAINYENNANSLRRKFMDAVFERSDADIQLTLAEYRRAADPQNSLDNEYLDLFENYIRALNGGESLLILAEYQYAQTKAYAHLLSAKVSLANNAVETLYLEVANAKFAALNVKQRDSFDFDLSNLELILAAMEGNPDLALRAASQHAKLGVANGRINTAPAILSSTVIALDRAGYSDEALTLSSQFVTLNRNANGTLAFDYLYNHGRLLNSASRFDDAILYLEAAREQLTDPAIEPLVLRQLLLSYAATSKNDLGKIVRRELLLNLNKINNPLLTNTSTPILARADYLLAENLSADAVESLKAAYDVAEREQFDAQKQYQLRLSALRVKADSLATADWIEEASSQNSKFATKLSRQRSSQFVALAIALLSFAGFLAIVIKNRQLKKETLKHLRAAQVKGQFLNLIGHEARVNLQGISSFVQSLKASSVSMEHLPTVQVIGSHASSLSQSISDFIFSARIISGDRPIKEQQFNLVEYKSRMLPLWQDNIGGRDVVISVDISPKIPPLLLDTFFLETAMSQVVKIAIETTRVGTVEVEFTNEQSLKGLRLNVVIEDMGSGIANEDLHSIFDFFEVDENGVSKTTQMQPLGYPIAKNAVEAMGGVMTITSKPGHGTRVTFSIPVKRAAANDLTDQLDG